MASRAKPKKRLVLVEGLVDDVSASSDDGGTTWDQSFFLCPWNALGGELREDTLWVDVFVGAKGNLHLGDRLEGKSARGSSAARATSPSHRAQRP